MARVTEGTTTGRRRATSGRRIVVAMSGGVDSSLVAALLHHQGHEVIGLTLQLYDHGEAIGRRSGCCAGQDIQDARRIADHLGIAHYVLDYERRFEQAVMGAFADSYLAGETPIPCVNCNQHIKFRELLDTARELGADALATGHYVQRRDGASGPTLHRGADAHRDQSYFLFATTREQLAALWFPIGGLSKDEVRRQARAWALPVADKPDSQDICFVPSGRYADIIERLRPGAIEGGDIVHVDGRVLGHHAGIVNYTIGQRRGLKIAGGEALYVIRLDRQRRQVVVGPRQDLHTQILTLRNVNWLGDEPLEQFGDRGTGIQVRIRSSQPVQPATLFDGRPGGPARVVLEAGEYGVAAGQACVFYSDTGTEARVLGGGWIARTSGRPDRPGVAGAEARQLVG